MLHISVIVLLVVAFLVTVYYRCSSVTQNPAILLEGKTIRNAAYKFVSWKNILILSVCLPITLLMWYHNLQVQGGMFLAGALSIALIGSYHMQTSTYANIATAQQIVSSTNDGFRTASLISASGGIMLHAIFLLAITYLSHYSWNMTKFFLLGIASAGTIICWCGGVFTKSADISADLLGKIDARMNEDDMNNPATTADNVGDNVGDFLLSSKSTVVIFSCVTAVVAHYLGNTYLLSVSIITAASMLPILTWLAPNSNLRLRMLLYVLATTILNICGANMLLQNGVHLVLYIAGSIGAVAVCMAAYMMTGKPASQRVARITRFGSALNVIAGLDEGYRGTNTIFIIIAAVSAITLRYVTSLNTTCYVIAGAVSLSPALITLDNQGPMYDNAAGILERSAPEHRDKADYLDDLGNNTKAATKIYGFYTAFWSVIGLCMCYFASYRASYTNAILTGAQPQLWGNIALGVALSCALSSISLNSVIKTAFRIIGFIKDAAWQRVTLNEHIEVVAQLTRLSIRTVVELLLLVAAFAATAVLIPASLPYILISIIIFSFGSGLQMVITGSLLDSVKKYIGLYEGKKTEHYRNAVVGDIVGDPLKDTTGPIHIQVIILYTIIGMVTC
jgi:K(+)-stimulated pyrophosphate-energized sodium pump